MYVDANFRYTKSIPIRFQLKKHFFWEKEKREGEKTIY